MSGAGVIGRQERAHCGQLVGHGARRIQARDLLSFRQFDAELTRIPGCQRLRFNAKAVNQRISRRSCFESPCNSEPFEIATARNARPIQSQRCRRRRGLAVRSAAINRCPVDKLAFGNTFETIR